MDAHTRAPAPCAHGRAPAHKKARRRPRFLPLPHHMQMRGSPPGTARSPRAPLRPECDARDCRQAHAVLEVRYEGCGGGGDVDSSAARARVSEAMTFDAAEGVPRLGLSAVSSCGQSNF